MLPKEAVRLPDSIRSYDEDFAQVTNFESLMASLQLRGFQRPLRKYSVPSDVDERFASICQKVLSLTPGGKTNLNEVKIEGVIKTQLLASLAEAFGGHRLPNSLLHTMTSLDKVLTFYSTGVDMLSPYDRLELGVRSGSLPANLTVQLEPLRFDPSTATSEIGRVTAFPRSSTILSTPEAKKKWDPVKAKHSPWRNSENDD